MKTSKLSVLLLFLIIGFAGCKKDEDNEIPVIPEETGAIFVTVSYNGQPFPGATVTTEPETSEVTTNAMGNVLIQDVPEGIYQVFATFDEFGSGSGAADVDAGDVSNVNILMIPGAFEDLMVNIVSVNPQNATVGEAVNITAVVNDNEDEDNEIAFEWITDLDGLISTEGVAIDNYAMVQYIFETAGERTLVVTVTDTDGNTDTDSTTINIVEPPEPVVLEPIEAVGNALHLNWSQTDEDNFISYRIYREGQFGFTQIEQVFDVNTTTFIDTDVSIGIEYNYRIGLHLSGNNEIHSNIETGLFDGEYIYIGTGLDMLLHDPVNPIIYGLDTDNNSLLFINTELEEVVNTINVGSAPTDMDFSLDNQLLYIANSGSTEITVVDIASQTVQSTFFAEVGNGSWDGNPNTLAVLANDLLAFSGADNYGYVKLSNITNGNNVFTTNQGYYSPYLVANSDGTKLFVGETGSNSELMRFNLSSNQLVLEQTSNDYSTQSPQIFITDNDEFIYCGARKFMASNLLNILGTFDDYIYAINSDGSLAIGESEIFNGLNFNSVHVLPLSTKVSVFANDDSTAWLYHEQTARLYSVTVE